MRTYSSYLSDWQSLTMNSSTSNQTLGMKLINDAIRYLATEFYFNESSYTVPGGSLAQTQGYTLPQDFELMENVTVNVGGYLWQPRPSPSRKHFDTINLIPYYNDYPQFYFIWNGSLNIWPIPASSGNTITFNYKKRVTDLSMTDVTGTCNATNASTSITNGSSFANWMGQSGWIQIAHNSTNSANGDANWYQIASVTSSSVLTLNNKYTGANVTGGSFTIGDVPILPEDYQDMPLYRALSIYFTSIVPDASRATMYKELYDRSYKQLDDKYGSKDYSPVLTDVNAPVYNPNLFPRSLSQA